MSFVTYSLLEHGLPTSDALFDPNDTYITVVSTHSLAVGGAGLQGAGYTAIKSLFNVIYEGPPAFNHFHYERTAPSQVLLIFEKKPCQPEQNPAQDVLKMEKTPEETT